MSRHLQLTLGYSVAILLVVITTQGPATLFGIAAILAVCAVVAAIRYTQSSALVTPLQQVGAALDAVAQGDLEYALPRQMPAEFATIAHSYHTMRDILRDRQRDLEIQLRRTSLLTQISIELCESLDTTMIAERVLRVLGSSLNIDSATIILSPPESPTRLGMRWENRHLQQLDPPRIAQMLDYGMEGWVQQTTSSAVLADVSTSERWQAGGGSQTGSAIVLTLRQDTDALGSLTVYAQHTNAFTNHDLLLMEGIVAQTSVAISLSLRFQAERQHTEQLGALVGRRTDELQRSRDLLRLVFDHLPEGLLLLDADGEILAANSTFCRSIVGRMPRETVGSRYHQLWRDLMQQSELSLTPQGPSESGVPLALAEGEAFTSIAASWRVLSSDMMGQQRWYAVERTPIAGPQGTAEQCLERWRDITQQEELQRRLLVHEQLTSLGRLAASVAHEVGNPLQSALGCLELCREDQGLSPLSHEYLDLALGELDRMARTMASLRNLYRPPQIVWEPVDLNQIIRQVGQFTQHQLDRTRVRLHLHLDGELPPITGQPDALRQVFLNLVLNAHEAMEQGGEIHVSTVHKPTDRICQVIIRDTGVGMSADQLAHIFEPFRSMKAQGVGLGLYLSRQIITQHTGHIEISSQLGQGTTIIMQFPWNDAGPWRPHRAQRSA
ncbi:PAS domain-containing protein [Oscillochloris sp. ZM17-4]|uniref:ATP-binding protein n=1 Tax=Oscillochloris sp. ZM17-4 TaxID=2866714 RepID=UPI001C72CB58|nr:ATP-binding protein [Oscillochloris sp. ZM17-4]MBX0328083.1 PAS domain-containing protein [Oscillochloris sp. ZM17-4]